MLARKVLLHLIPPSLLVVAVLGSIIGELRRGQKMPPLGRWGVEERGDRWALRSA